MLMLHFKCRTNVKYDASFKHYIMSNNMNHYVEHLGKVKTVAVRFYFYIKKLELVRYLHLTNLTSYHLKDTRTVL